MNAYEAKKESIKSQYQIITELIESESKKGSKKLNTYLCSSLYFCGSLHYEVAKMLANQGFDVSVTKKTSDLFSTNIISWQNKENGRIGSLSYITETDLEEEEKIKELDGDNFSNIPLTTILEEIKKTTDPSKTFSLIGTLSSEIIDFLLNQGMDLKVEKTDSYSFNTVVLSNLKRIGTLTYIDKTKSKKIADPYIIEKTQTKKAQSLLEEALLSINKAVLGGRKDTNILKGAFSFEIAQMLAEDGFDVTVIKRKNDKESFNSISWENAKEGKKGTITYICKGNFILYE